MNQSEYETLMMAHDNLQRELSDIKRLMDKDKHELIKSNIELNKRVQELESRIADDEHFVAEILEQNKRYREALEFYSDIELYDEYDHPELGLTTDVNIDKGKKARKVLEGEE